MDSLTPEELQKLQAAANAEMKQYQRLRQKFHTDPLEAKLHIPYTDSDEFTTLIQKMVQDESEIKEQIHTLQSDLEAEKQARQKSERINMRFQWANVILVALTLIATIIFGLGLHSCSASITNDTSVIQESGFAVTDSSSTRPS